MFAKEINCDDEKGLKEKKNAFKNSKQMYDTVRASTFVTVRANRRVQSQSDKHVFM